MTVPGTRPSPNAESGAGGGQGPAATRATWRHRDGTIRVDHMDAAAGDYHGPARTGTGS